MKNEYSKALNSGDARRIGRSKAIIFGSIGLVIGYLLFVFMEAGYNNSILETLLWFTDISYKLNIAIGIISFYLSALILGEKAGESILIYKKNPYLTAFFYGFVILVSGSFTGSLVGFIREGLIVEGSVIDAFKSYIIAPMFWILFFGFWVNLVLAYFFGDSISKASTIFMKGKWEDLIISTFEIDKSVLEKYLLENTDLDLYHGKALFSLVAFTFSEVRFFGFKIPFHQRFGEINFRFYVKSKNKRQNGVIFLKEYAPKPLIALIANKFYNEPFFYKKIKRKKVVQNDQLIMQYHCQKGTIQAIANNQCKNLKENSMEEFIVDRYVAFVKGRKSTAYQYKIFHKPWKLYQVESFKMSESIMGLLPDAFKDANLVSQYYVDGSSISVDKGIIK